MTSDAVDQDGQAQTSLDTAAARTLATTTKSAPQTCEITPRWLLRMLPWAEATGGTFRINRRATYSVGDGRVSFATIGPAVSVIPPSLRELPLLRGFDDLPVLAALASGFTQRELRAGEVIAEVGRPADRLVVVTKGKLAKSAEGKFGHHAVFGRLADGDHIGDQALLTPDATWDFTLTAETASTVMTLGRSVFQDVMARSAPLRSQVERYRTVPGRPMNKYGEPDIEVASGHAGEPLLPQTYVDYELAPREYELSVSQTVMQVHTRVADLFNNPMNQVEEQLRLTVEALRERQEYEMINNPEFGLLHNADVKHRVHTSNGPPTPDDLDELLSRRKRSSRFFLAHPRAIAAFRRECNRRGLYPQDIDVAGSALTAWRGVPILPSNKIPITAGHTTSIMVMRTGVENQGVYGLHQTGIPDEYQPSLSVRFMGINEKAVISYLISAYYSIVVPVPDALGILENVELGH